MRGAAVTLAPHTPEQPHPSRDLRGLQLPTRFDSQSGLGIANAYDGFGRLASSTTDLTGPSPRTLSYGYDAEGNRTQLLHPDGALFNIWYDGLNRPYYLFHSGWSGMAYVSYSPFGGPGAMGHAATTSYGYDGVQRPALLAHNFSGGTGLVVWTYGRNPAGQLSTIARDNDAFAWTGHYGVNRPYTTNGRNQYSAAGGTTLLYDDNGNLTSETTLNVTRTYTYDIENRLIGASVPGGSQVQLGYDPLGRLSWTTGSPNFTRFLYDGDALVAEYDYAGTTMIKRYAHWVGQPAPAEAGVPLVSYEGASLENAAGRWLIADHQGSIIAAAHPSGATDWVNTYDEYGIPGAGNQGRFQYTGQIWLPELGMYHYKARVYSPTLGRFLQTDPVGYEDQFNLYAYVGNDPLNHSDPTGTRIHVAAGQEGVVTADINQHAESTFSTDRNGNVQMSFRRTITDTGSRLSRLSTYDRMLSDAIKSEKVIEIQRLDENAVIHDPRLGAVNILHQDIGGGVTYPADDGSGNQSVFYWSGDGALISSARAITGEVLLQTRADILMHELVDHAIPDVLGLGGQQGLRFENRVRRERRMLPRGPDRLHPSRD